MIRNKINDKELCVICKKEIEGFGNNPSPLSGSGRCCDLCNSKYVIPARLKQHEVEKQLNTHDGDVFELKDEFVIDVPELGEFTDEVGRDSVHSSWKQLFNELVDEGEERIDRMVGSKRGVEHPDNLLKEVTPAISNYLSGIKESLAKNIESVAKYLVNFVKKNYALKDEQPEELQEEVVDEEIPAEIEDSSPDVLVKLQEDVITFITNSSAGKKNTSKRFETPIVETTYRNLNNANYEKGSVILSVVYEHDEDDSYYGWYAMDAYIKFADGKITRIGSRNADYINLAKQNIKELINKIKSHLK